jgi:integrase
MRVTYLERSPGTWRLRIENGKDPEGRRQFSYETVRGNEEAAQRRRFELLQAHEQGSWTQPDKLLFGEFLRGWIEQRQALGKISRASAENYAAVLRSTVVSTLGGIRLQQVKGVQIQALYTKLLATLAPETVRHIHKILACAFKGARKARLIIVNPIEEVEAPKATARKAKALDDAGVERLLAAVAGDWKEPLVLIGLGAGLRRGEICGLRWKDVDLDGRRLHVRGQLLQYDDGTTEWRAPKTAAGTRVVSIPGELVDLLRGLRRTAAEHRLRAGLGGGLDDAYVFTRDGDRPILPDSLTMSFTALCRGVGLPEFTFHGTRHTHITALLKRVGREGAKAVSKRAGHANVNVTLDVYQAVFESDDRELGDLASGILRKR